MLTKLRIQNFKGWKDTEEIRMSPITLFFGANSSGKSSIGQFLMMLKQTVESSDRKAVLYPGGKNSPVHLGSFQEMVYKRNPDNLIKFFYEWQLPSLLTVKDPIGGKSYTGEYLSFQSSVGRSTKDHFLLNVEEFNYRLLDKDGLESLCVGLEKNPEKNSEYKAISDDYKLVRQIGRPWAFKGAVRFYGFPDEMVAYHQNADFVQDLMLLQENLFKSIFYLGPFRTKAERLYSWAGTEPESVGYSGENTIAAILASRNRKISLGYNKHYKLIEEIIAVKFKEMGLIEEFEVKPISEQRQEYEVKVRAKGSQEWVDLPDVGFGISQVLPVLAQCFYAPPGSIILMEQPEIHLHPSAQSALADVMIDVIQSREHGQDRNIQLVIESHSEHFLRRLQRRIAEGVIPQEKVTGYFANIARTPAKLEPLEIDEYGTIRNWPDNFFGDEMGDIIGQAKAALKKRMEHANSEKQERSE